MQAALFCYEQGFFNEYGGIFTASTKHFLWSRPAGSDGDHCVMQTDFMFIIQHISLHQPLDFGHTSVKISSKVICATR